MPVDVLYQPEAVIPAAVAAFGGITVGSPGAPVRVDVDAVNGEITKPMLVVERDVQSWWRAPIDRDQLGLVRFTVAALGESIAQAVTLRGRVIAVMVGMGPSGSWTTPLTVPGLVVVDRELVGPFHPPQVAGGLAQASATFEVTLERAS